MTSVLLAKAEPSAAVQAVATLFAFVIVLGPIVFLIVMLARRSARAATAARDEAQRQAHARAAWMAHQQQAELHRRYQEMSARFGQQAAERIMRREAWQGMTEDMLLAMLGQPDTAEDKVLKTKRKRVLKYGRIGATNSFQRKFTFEDGVLVGWDDKG